MAVNYAAKYAQQVDERFKLEALSNSAVNHEYDFIGVETVNVYSVPVVAMNDYKKSGANRYGEPSELENEVQEMTLTRDRSFTFTIDRKNRDDTQMTLEAGKALQRQLDEVVIPEIDTYRFAKICAGTAVSVEETVTKANAYESFLTVQEALDELKAPQAGRICYCSSGYYKKIKLDDAFTKKGDMATQIAIKGIIGEIDGVPVVKVPKSYLPTGVEFFITNSIATTAPTKLTDYTIHDNPPGISGWLVEGRVRYDAFVLNSKKNAIGVCKAKTEDETQQGEQTEQEGEKTNE